MCIECHLATYCLFNIGITRVKIIYRTDDQQNSFFVSVKLCLFDLVENFDETRKSKNKELTKQFRSAT